MVTLETPNRMSLTSTVTPLEAADAAAAVQVLARGMRDNPLHVAAFGADPERRQEAIGRMFGLYSRKPAFSANGAIARDEDGTPIGFYSASAPGSCLPSATQIRLMTPVFWLLRVPGARRVTRWLAEWSGHDPAEPHWHFGPVAVVPERQGTGVGTALLRHFCARMDAEGATAYLETDKAINVRFYQKFGFEVIGEADVIGVPNWFMIRRPGAGERHRESA